MPIEGDRGTESALTGDSAESKSSYSLADLNKLRDPAKFAATWLAIQSRIMGTGLQRAVIVFGPPETGPFAPIAVWPEKALGSPGLVAGIERAIARKELVIEAGKRAPTDENTKRKIDVIAIPLLVDEQIAGAVAVVLAHCSAAERNSAISQLTWGIAWLEVLSRRSRYSAGDRLSTVLELIATGLEHERFQASATAVATELAGILHCERVSIGFQRGRHTQVHALSHSASFVRKANVIRAVEAAMDEAIDQQATIVYPSGDAGPVQVTRAHEGLAETHGAGAICTVPVAAGDRILGAICLERTADEPFDERTMKLCEHIGALLGPLLDIKRKDDRWLVQKAGDSIRDYARKLIGPRHTLLKTISYGLLIMLVFFSVFDGDYRVTADARIEGVVQRALAAPLAGYVAEANVRAGDIVKKGDVMFKLDDRELWLERLKWTSQKLQYQREYSEAVAKRDRAQANVLAAQIKQAEAQVALIEEQLRRVQVAAPFDGVVVAGDLSQSLGAPVERGDVLFELAPLNQYRVILNVNELDVGELNVGQSGALALTGLPGEKTPITVNKITPVATAEEGENFFRVEASLQHDPSGLLRPGMEGVGKVDIGERKLIWIWTHKIVYWVRMFFWSWWP
jgi:RND family efflux transporter MFP subunit